MILACIFIGLFSVSIILLIVQIKNNNGLKKRITILEDALKDKLIKLSYRNGFYDGSFNIIEREHSKTPGSVYTFRVYVTELEKYDNGYSKFRLDDVDMKFGFDKSKYNHIIDCAKADFLEIRETKDITFLEKDKDLSEVRKDKLERILNEEK